ncbi:MAG: alpha/beta hydrolase [Ardenticatenaceae bacterium]|nr:alpha/beta hydrolase [Ardenticatenaceae bacterium]
MAALAIGLISWTRGTLAPTDTALQALTSDAQVQVSPADGLITFAAAGQTADTGLIFYPGGHVDYRAYAPPLRQIAAQGYFVAVAEMPLDLAFFKTNAADAIIAANPGIQHWVIGGHSLGGVAAASYASEHAAIEGIAFWASYPANDALKDSAIKVISIFGTQDGLATKQDIDDSQPLLPTEAQFVAITGGNHSQFGAYGFQQGDNPATISPEEQWAQIAEVMVQFLATVNE